VSTVEKDRNPTRTDEVAAPPPDRAGSFRRSSADSIDATLKATVMKYTKQLMLLVFALLFMGAVYVRIAKPRSKKSNGNARKRRFVKS
jgi:hypothetical protein